MRASESPEMVAIRAEWRRFKAAAEPVRVPVLSLTEEQRRKRDALLSRVSAKQEIRRITKPQRAEAEFERVRAEVLAKRGLKPGA